MTSGYQSVFEVTRGQIVESIHFGAAAVVDVQGRLLACLGDPHKVAFLRSTAKPFQALPFIEHGGHEKYNFETHEIAITCASHSGTDEHVATIQAIQAKIGVTVDDLMCGMHYPFHEASADAMKIRGEAPTPYRHNCSGKHTGMLAHAKMLGAPTENYLDLEHPVQQAYPFWLGRNVRASPQKKSKSASMAVPRPTLPCPSTMPPLGLPAWVTRARSAPQRAQACKTITRAMMTRPDMVAGPGRFDTLLMQTTKGRIFTKTGAEGYQGVGLLPGALGADSPGIGIAIKISDGDPSGRARHGVALAILQALGALIACRTGRTGRFWAANTTLQLSQNKYRPKPPAFVLDLN
jgi:L-asparaginase II